MALTNLVVPSETETNGNGFCLKHSKGQSWLIPIVKPWQIASPGSKNHQKVHRYQNKLQKTNVCKEVRVAIQNV